MSDAILDVYLLRTLPGVDKRSDGSFYLKTQEPPQKKKDDKHIRNRGENR